MRGRVSEEERTQLHLTLGESVGAGWRLFHNASNAQVLYAGAIGFLEKALSLPQTSYQRRASTSVTLAAAYLYMDDNASLAVIEQNVSIIKMVNAPLVTRQLANYIQQGLLITSPFTPYPFTTIISSTSTDRSWIETFFVLACVGLVAGCFSIIAGSSK